MSSAQRPRQQGLRGQRPTFFLMSFSHCKKQLGAEWAEIQNLNCLSKLLSLNPQNVQYSVTDLYLRPCCGSNGSPFLQILQTLFLAAVAMFTLKVGAFVDA